LEYFLDRDTKYYNHIKRMSAVIRIPLDSDSLFLEGELNIPKAANGIILFAHGSGSSRHSPRNKYVAEALQKDGVATLLVDLLTPKEEEFDIKAQKTSYNIPGLVLNKFNINLLAKRLATITDWILENPDTQNLLLGYFGASTGTAAAAIVAAAAQRHNNNNNNISAIVSRSGRPDLAGLDSLSKIKAPTLLIVGGNDSRKVIDLNKDVLNQLGSEKKKLAVVPNATHLFEEPGTIEEVARLASGWFRCYFQIESHRSSSSSRHTEQ
jgi:putative phosphoribosyl transferase